MASSTTKTGLYSTYQPGDGRIVVGRYYTNKDQRYASVELDDLVFFNSSLTVPDIEKISQLSHLE